jgi:hypothetical protein
VSAPAQATLPGQNGKIAIHTNATAGARDLAVWELRNVEVYDGGADGNATTEAGNAPFEVGGLFFP